MPIISLRAFEKTDIPSFHSWMNNEESLELIGRVPQSLEQVEKLVEELQKEGLLLAIQSDTNELLGEVHLCKMEQEHGRAEIGILLAPEARGQGIGKIAMSLMLDIAFDQLRLHRVYLTTRGMNARAQALYQKIAFTVEGRLREHAYVGGKYHDTILMGILASEWKQTRQTLANLQLSSLNFTQA
jgi:diamine N-acetyltransferase